MQMFRAACGKCQWVFDVVVLPLPVTIAAGAMENTCCPMCGNRKRNTCAPARALTLGENAHKTGLEAARKGGSIMSSQETA